MKDEVSVGAEVIKSVVLLWRREVKSVDVERYPSFSPIEVCLQ